jgi:hypothetical protein
MMKTRVLLSIFMLLMASCRSAVSQPETPLPTYQATVNHDCAPWDGGAFTILIPFNEVNTIQVSIWEPIEIDHVASFSFPDQSGRVGYAGLDTGEPLKGTVSLRNLKDGTQMEGEFNLSTDSGSQLEGNFIATWGDFVPLCG